MLHLLYYSYELRDSLAPILGYKYIFFSCIVHRSSAVSTGILITTAEVFVAVHEYLFSFPLNSLRSPENIAQKYLSNRKDILPSQ